jgi:hypothetical protein
MPKSLLLIIIGTVKYVAGRQLLVHVGKNTIPYNDIVGRSRKVPIVSQRQAAGK